MRVNYYGITGREMRIDSIRTCMYVAYVLLRLVWRNPSLAVITLRYYHSYEFVK